MATATFLGEQQDITDPKAAALVAGQTRERPCSVRQQPVACRSEAQRTFTDDTRVLQIGDLLGRQAEQTGEHRLVVLPEERCR